MSFLIYAQVLLKMGQALESNVDRVFQGLYLFPKRRFLWNFLGLITMTLHSSEIFSKSPSSETSKGA